MDPLIRTPMAIAASYFPFLISFDTAMGNSNEPGTEIVVMFLGWTLYRFTSVSVHPVTNGEMTSVFHRAWTGGMAIR